MENNLYDYNWGRSIDRTDRLSFERWPDPEGYFERTFKVRWGSETMKNCYLHSGRAQVKLFFGKRQHVLLQTAWRNVVSAMRIADAAVLYFWKYRRVADNREPADSDFNCSLRTAESDCSIPFIAQLFKQYESRLASAGQLPRPKDKIGNPGLDEARIKMMAAWSDCAEYFERVYNQCPRTPETKTQLAISRELVDQFKKVVKSFDLCVKTSLLMQAKVDALIADGSTT
jgi:hypothetical protein